MLSCRDTGSAQNILPVIKELRVRNEVRLKVIAQEPGSSYLTGHGIDVFTLKSKPIASPCSDGRVSLLQEVQEHFASASPDATLTCLSGPGLGVDEALQAVADGVPSFTLQSADGWVATGFGSKALTYFVPNDRAAERTRAQGVVNVVLTGYPKYESYLERTVGNSDLECLRSYHSADNSRKRRFVFCGQPLADFSGYRPCVRGVLKRLASQDNVEIYYRPHPKEDSHWVAGLLSECDMAGQPILLDPEPQVERSLLHSDVVLSCYSTCLQDLLYLQSSIDFPIGVGLAVLWQADLNETVQRNYGQEYPAFIGAGLNIVVHEESQLDEALVAALELKRSGRLCTLARQRITRFERPSAKVADYVMKALRK